MLTAKFALVVLSTLSSPATADSVADSGDVGQDRASSDPSGVSPISERHKGCLDLMNRVLIGFGFGPVAENNPSNPITKAYASRFRFSPKSGMPLVAAALKTGKGPDVVIFKELRGDSTGHQPELKAPRFSQRVQSFYNGKEFKVEIRGGAMGPVTIHADPSRDGKTCTLTQIEVKAQVRDLEAEENDRNSLLADGIQNPKIDPIYKWIPKTIPAQQCPRTLGSLIQVSNDPRRAEYDTCQLLNDFLPSEGR
jgi:hypothetical protein